MDLLFECKIPARKFGGTKVEDLYLDSAKSSTGVARSEGTGEVEKRKGGEERVKSKDQLLINEVEKV